MRERLTNGALLGLFLGMLAAIGEWLRLSLSAPGFGFQPTLLIYAEIVDGCVGLAAGLLMAGIWVLFRRRLICRSEQNEASALKDGCLTAFGMTKTRQNSQPQIVLTWRRREPVTVPAAPRPAITRRTALQLGLAAASAGTLGLGALAWSVTRPRPQGASAAYAYAPLRDGLAPERTNVLLVTLDTLRADQLGVYGHPYVKTPALDRLAGQGARFDMHLVQEPATNPSHGSIFTGMYPPSNGLRVHMVDKLQSSLETLAGVFRGAGYYTAGIYSWLSLDDAYSGFQRGFATYQNVAGGLPRALENPVGRRVAAEYRVAEQYLLAAKAVSESTGVQQQMEWKNKGRADVTTEAAIAELQALGKQPFFLWVHYFDPHYPYTPPPPYDNQYNPNYSGKLTFDMDTIEAIEKGRLQPTPEDVKRLMGLYQGEITFMDAQLGRLFTALEQMQLSEKTVLAITADHGESFGEHSTFQEETDWFHPHDLYNTEQRSPLIIRYPSQIKAGSVIEAPTQALDLFPTLLELAGLKVPAQNQGKSLLPLLAGGTGADRASFASMPDYVFTSVAVPGWKYIRNNPSGSHELYDLRADAGETRNVSMEHPNLVRELEAKLQAWMKAVKIS